MSDDMTHLQEIEARCQHLDPGPWAWRQGYEIGNRVHWALESPKSAAEGRVVSYLAVLRHCYPNSLGEYSGEPVEDDPYLDFMARSRDDIEWLCQQLRAALEARSPWPQPDFRQAPDWARWWAISADGCQTWFEVEPQMMPGFGEWGAPETAQVLHDGMIDIPLGVDWRLLKVERPTEAK